MVIKMEKFGKMLISRPAGREAFLAAKAYVLPEKNELIELDFSEVAVLGPSWADEFIRELKLVNPNIKYLNTDNLSVKNTLEFIK